VDQVTALFHLLARYAVNTQPTSIVEELLPVAVPVYAGQPSAITGQAAGRLLDARLSTQTRTEAEVRESLADALAIENLETLLEDAVEARRQELVAARRGMRRQMERREGARTVEWLRGIDDLSRGSFDLLTLTVLYPC
jgi:chromosome condensin MukBEF complex kleisin-like MukF subunit